MKLKRMILVLIASAIAIVSGIVFFAEPDTDKLIDDYEDITQPVDKTDDNKITNVDKETPDKTVKPTTTKKAVTPEITAWNNSSGEMAIRGIIPSVIEVGALCKFILYN